jgi:multidrug efflux pump subunit AcrA (membrane-fusion protein)
MAREGCPGSNPDLEEKLMCAQQARERAEAEAATAKRIATEALRLMSKAQFEELRQNLGELDVLAGFGGPGRADL